jgi:hypothetical protein
VTKWVLLLAGQLADHLTDPAAVADLETDLIGEIARLPLGAQIRVEFPGEVAGLVRVAAPPRRTAPACRGLCRGQAFARGGRLLRPDGERGPTRPATGGRCPGTVAVRSGVARRVPGHRARSDRHAAWAVRRRAPGDGSRGPVPVDLQLARRQFRQHFALPGRLPHRRRPGADLSAGHQLAQRRGRADRGQRRRRRPAGDQPRCGQLRSRPPARQPDASRSSATVEDEAQWLAASSPRRGRDCVRSRSRAPPRCSCAGAATSRCWLRR